MMINNQISKYNSGFSSSFLNWEDRPQNIVNKINTVFSVLKQDDRSQWGVYNGRTNYHLLNMNDHQLVKKIIANSPLQKEFFFLDIGAGDFQWGRGVCKFINSQDDLPSDLNVHIISIRGEAGKERRKKCGQCYLYELTAFKVENLFNEFLDRNLCLENKLDLVVSSWCFRHLVDPLGTFVQTYNLLRPVQGMLMMDGFFYQDHQGKYLDKNPGEEPNSYLVNLLVHTRAPFLLYPYNKGGSLWQFLIQRPNNNPCQLSMNYLEIQPCSSRAQIGSKCITKFEMPSEKYDLTYLDNIKLPVDHLYGDLSLYNDLIDCLDGNS